MLIHLTPNVSRILKNALRLQRHQATSDNVQQRSTFRGDVNYFPFDVIVFAMLPANGIWRETVSLLDVMRP